MTENEKYLVRKVMDRFDFLYTYSFTHKDEIVVIQEIDDYGIYYKNYQEWLEDFTYDVIDDLKNEDVDYPYLTFSEFLVFIDNYKKLKDSRIEIRKLINRAYELNKGEIK